MPLDQLPDVIAGIVVAAAFLVGLVMAYRRGYRAALPIRRGEFDFLASGLKLHGTSWRVEFTSADHGDSESSTATLQFEQAGSRVVGTGRQGHSQTWHLEGNVHQRQLVCQTIGWGEDRSSLAWLMLRMEADDQTLSGYRIAWDRQGSLLNVTEVSLHRETAARVALAG